MPKKLRPLPTRVMGRGGWVKVKLEHDIVDEGVACVGLFRRETRQMLVDASLPIDRQWWVYFHEMHHMALSDAGLEDQMTEDAVEAHCSAVATARMREMFG